MVDPAALAAALVAVLAYAAAVRRLGRRGRRWPAGRTLAGAAAVAVGVAATQGPLAAAEGGDLRAHMGQHILLGMVVPLLAALAAPITLALQGGAPATRRAVRVVLRGPAGRALGHPLVGFAAFGTGIVALYLTPLLDVAAGNGWVHLAVHVHVVVSGFLFLVPLVGADVLPHPVPFGARLLAALAAVPFHAFVGLALLVADAPAAPRSYPSLDEQRTAAAMLMGSGELLTLAVAAAVFARWWSAEARAGAREPSPSAVP